MMRSPVTGALMSVALIGQAHAQTAGNEKVVADLQKNLFRPGSESSSLPLHQVLSEISLKWGVSFVFDSRIVKGKLIPGIVTDSGEFSEDRLAESLHAADLDLRRINDKTYAIRAAALSTTPADPAAAAYAGPPPADLVIVTGSRIPVMNAVLANPVTTLRGAEFDIRGISRAEDLTNTLPQVFASAGANTSNGATGTAEVSLRGLGATRTLVLVNGRRLQYGSSISSAPDINQIPGALVERIEVLTGGASPAYGSDALAGVVNFIMLTDFEGVRIVGQIGGFQHHNNNAKAQNVLRNAFPSPGSDFSIPKSSVFDGASQEITLIMGATRKDGRGNVTAYAGYRNNDAILQSDRDYSKCAYRGGDPVFDCAGSPTTPIGRFITINGDFTLDEDGPGNTLRSSTPGDIFNYAPTNFYQRPDERFTLGAFGHYLVADQFELYSEAMFYDYWSHAQIAHTGTFLATRRVNCDNPLLDTPGSNWLDALGCTKADIASGAEVSFLPGRRFVEADPRDEAINLTSYRLLGGVRGHVSDAWAYDAYFQYGSTRNTHILDNDVVTDNIQNALLAIDDGAGGVQCRDPQARAQGCIPLNIFEIGGISERQLEYISKRAYLTGYTKQYLAEIVFSGDLDGYGVRSPWAEDGARIVLGASWRKDTLDYNPDSLYEFGLVAGSIGESPPISGEIESTDLFLEAQWPLVSGMTLAEWVTAHAYYRISEVSAARAYSTWKISGDWQVTPDFRVRGGWQRAARSANVLESFTPISVGLTTLPALPGNRRDPCAGDLVFTDTDGDGEDDIEAPLATPVECARSGVTAAQYGAILDNPAGQYNALFGGNPDLAPESSDTYTIGLVLTPDTFAPGALVLSVDYFDISVDGFINTLAPSTTLNQCLETGDAYFCDRVRRDNRGSLWLSPNAHISATNINTGSLSTSGVDVNFNWGVELEELGIGDAGVIEMDFVGTYVFDMKTRELPAREAEEFDCAGYYAGRCGGPNPRWRHRLITTWQTPFGVDATLSWRRFSSVRQGDSVAGFTAPPEDEDFSLEGRNYIDLELSCDVTENWDARIGVNNVFDKDPPLTSQTPGFANGNTFPQTYDATGRFLFVGATIDF